MLKGFFVGRRCDSEYVGPASRIRAPAEGCRSAAIISPVEYGKREMQSASLKEAELARRRLELEARGSAKRATRAEAERDTTCHEAAMARLEIEGAINARVQMESELARL